MIKTVTSEQHAKIQAIADQITALNDYQLVELVVCLVGVPMQKINLAYHISVCDSEDLIDDGKFENEAMKGEF